MRMQRDAFNFARVSVENIERKAKGAHLGSGDRGAKKTVVASMMARTANGIVLRPCDH